MYDGIKGITSSALHFAMKVPIVGVAAAAIIAATVVAKNEKEVIEELKPKMEIAEVVKAPAVPIAKVVLLKGIVFFDFDKFNIDETAKEVLRKIAAQMSTQPDKLLVLAGHTDKVGSNEYNQLLSERRANSVKAELMKAGVSADRIVSIKGFGKSRLLPELSDYKNRRVTILSVEN